VQLYWLPPLLAGVLDLFLCALVLVHGPGKRLNQTLAFFALSLTSWNLDIAALYFFRPEYPELVWRLSESFDHVAPLRSHQALVFPELALRWSWIFRYGMLFIPPTVYHLALALTARWTLTNRLFLIAAYWTTFVLCLANSQGELVDHLKSFAWGYYPVGRPLYNLYTFAVLLYFSATLYQFVRGLIYSDSARQRQQFKIVLLGFAVWLPAGLTNLLPVYGISFFPLGNLGNVFLCGAMTYAIIKHRLLDLEIIITKTTASVAALLLWLTPLWILTAEVRQRIYGEDSAQLLPFALAVFVLSGLVFPWLLRVSEAWVRRMLWGQKYDSLQALSIFQKTIIHVLDQKKIVEDLREVLTDTLQTDLVSVYLLQPTTGVYVNPREENGRFLSDNPFLYALSQQQEPVVREEAVLKEKDAHAAQIAATLAEQQGEVCVPLRTQDRLIGFVLLGRKRNRDIFSSEDLRLLSTLGTEVAVALENARLYAELRASHIMLTRSDRLAAVGTLAAGIAHEIRNPLVAVQTFVQLLPERLDDPEFRTTFTQLTASELERVSSLINDLLTFARPAPVRPGTVQINDLAEQVVRLLDGQAKKKGVVLATRLMRELPPFPVDPEQIKQVFMNLVLNALQATSAGGTVTVATSLLHGPEGHEYCALEVQDTGEGIPAEHKEEIFDPFFTTKTAGTGLGLFITHQIIREHGGSIDVESIVGQGTRVLARLPLAGLPSQVETFNGTGQERAKNGVSSPQVSPLSPFFPPERPEEIK
jgi:signal transduction histidine kinase